MSDPIREYLAQIGRRSGQKSRRTLDPETALNMVRVREARRAFRRFRTSCFWPYRPDLEIGHPAAENDDVRQEGGELPRDGSKHRLRRAVPLIASASPPARGIQVGRNRVARLMREAGVARSARTLTNREGSWTLPT